ncbi:unnamed protein product [Prorocentrum cordatum]|uniref:Uncharacterized protein n=1 Tax=Prorocentrum cordatum TaxID=2364126 RepID=A0ABN9RA51_9DINO|nr:unnamed protein product [Polarella glacialis]
MAASRILLACCLLALAPHVAVAARHRRGAGRENATLGLAGGWEPEPCGELPEGVPCRALYEHPAGSEFVGPCPVATGPEPRPPVQRSQHLRPTSARRSPALGALGVTFKLICGGGCCPTCWAPDHVVAMDRHTTIESPYVVETAPQAPSHCGGAKCFKLICAQGFTEGHVEGDCCYSCVPGR